jgi:MFS transporter, ACS family, allantoate permease
LGDKLGNRLAVSSFGLICGITGMALIVGLPLSNNNGRLGGYYLTQATAMSFVALLSMIATNVVS